MIYLIEIKKKSIEKASPTHISLNTSGLWVVPTAAASRVKKENLAERDWKRWRRKRCREWKASNKGSDRKKKKELLSSFSPPAELCDPDRNVNIIAVVIFFFTLAFKRKLIFGIYIYTNALSFFLDQTLHPSIYVYSSKQKVAGGKSAHLLLQKFARGEEKRKQLSLSLYWKGKREVMEKLGHRDEKCVRGAVEKKTYIILYAEIGLKDSMYFECL